MGRFSICERLRIAAGGLLFLGILYIFFLAPYIAAERLAAQSEYAAARARIARLASDRRTDETASVSRNLHDNTYRSALPTGLGQGAFLTEVERAARAAGVAIDAVVPQPAVSADDLTVLPVEISFHGDYYAVLDFLRVLTEGERAVRLGDMEIKEEGNELKCVLPVEIASRMQTKDKDLP